MASYRSIIINADGETLFVGVADPDQMGALAEKHGLRRDFVLAFNVHSEQGRVSNPAGLVMAWHAEGEGMHA